MKAIIISADEIKKQIKGYNPNDAERFHSESAHLADKGFGNILKDSPNYRDVILLNGGTASGKTEFLSGQLYDEKAIIFDGTLSTEQGAEIKIRKIIKAKKVPIIYSIIPNNLPKSFAAFLHRDRKFSDKHFYRTHSGARKTLLWIAKHYPQIKIKIYENSFSEKQDPAFKRFIFENKKQKIAFLEKIQYNEEEIVKEVVGYDKNKSKNKES